MHGLLQVKTLLYSICRYAVAVSLIRKNISLICLVIDALWRILELLQCDNHRCNKQHEYFRFALVLNTSHAMNHIPDLLNQKSEYP